MSPISVLKIKNVESRQQKQDHGKSSGQPISLLAFLRAENCKLRDTIAQLERDTMVLRESLQKG
jgi:IS1 family transposase